ncbi:MAG TPA: carboxypeptidase regulatory-like domain-containing protein, partial [Candidatus Cloacimonadota bacterium]|nr:carboxypeptidase regulatory-like domain-containing protein [Candidatus Cloacimonadota bacterium]
LFVNDNLLETQNGVQLAPGATQDFTFTWTPITVEPHTLYGKVDLATDQNDDNDQTPPFNVIVQPEGTTTVYIGNPNSTTASYQYPVNFFYKSSLTQTIYLADEIGIGGAITSFKYFMNSAGNVPNNSPIKVWMANTSLTTFASGTSWIPSSEFQLVYDGGVTFPQGQIEVTIPLQSPFAYGGDNLVVMVQRPLDIEYYSTTNTFIYTAANETRTLYYYTDSATADPVSPPSGYTIANVPNISLTISTSGLATLQGNVTFNNAPISNVKVQVDGTARYAMTNNQGNYSLPYLTPGTVSITASKTLLNDVHIPDIVLVAEETTVQDIQMTMMSLISLSGQVVDGETGNPIAGANVKIAASETSETTTDANGGFVFPMIYSGQTYAITISKNGYTVYRSNIQVGTTNLVLPAIELESVPDYIEFLVGNPASTGGAYYYPANFYYKSSLAQMLYMADEINGDYCIGEDAAIMSFKFFANLNGDVPSDKPLKIWMANTSTPGLSTWLSLDQFTLVWDGTVDLNMAGLHELEFELMEPFPYEGNNLAIMVLRPLDSGYYSSSNVFINTPTPNYGNRTLYYMSDTAAPDPNNPPTTSTTASNVPNTWFAISTAGFSTLTGTVTSNGSPVAGAKVAVDGTTRSAITNADGEYALAYLIPGTVSLTTTKHGYIDVNTPGVVLIEDQTTIQNITIQQLPTVTVSGQINASDTSAGLGEAIIRLTGYEDYEAQSTASGSFTIPGVYASHTYNLRITRAGYQVHLDEIEVGTTNVTIPPITLNELANPPAGVVAVPYADRVELSWNEPGDGVDIWFSHTSQQNYSNAIGTGSEAQFIAAHRYSTAQLQAFGVAGATLEKIQFMPHEPTATYTVKIYTGGSAYNAGNLVHTQAVANIVTDQWNEVELSTPISIPSAEELWIGIDVDTPTGHPAGCDDGPELDGYGNMMYYSGEWATLLELNEALAYNWMIKGFATGAAGPRSFTLNKEEPFISRNISKTRKNTQPINLSAVRINSEIINTNSGQRFIQTNNTRSVTGYNVWRTPVSTMADENTWSQLALNLDTNYYEDFSWAQVPTGEFKYVVKAIYTGGVASVPAFSNTVFKNMTCTVSINIATADGASPAGAIVKLTNTDGNPEHIYTQTSASGTVIFPQVWHGIYTLNITKNGYQNYTQDNIIIAGDTYEHPLITLPVSAIFFAESFEGTFPPTGWTIVDSDGDGHNWMQWDYTPQDGVYCVASGSYDNNVGVLYPDNWLITNQIAFEAGRTHTLTFWVAAQDPAYPADHYSVMVSTTNTQPASFTSIYTETISSGNWEQRTLDLPYAGQNVYIAFRHHNCSDQYIMKIDMVEIARSQDADINLPIALKTALHGNYPNPFNPETTVSFDLAEESRVTIDIYNIKGQKVKTLINDNLNAGSHRVVWNGKDDAERNVSSGIYFYNMKSGKYTSTRKMILIK